MRGSSRRAVSDQLSPFVAIGVYIRPPPAIALLSLASTAASSAFKAQLEDSKAEGSGDATGGGAGAGAGAGERQVTQQSAGGSLCSSPKNLS